MDPESPELLALLLKKIPALQPKLGGEQYALSNDISHIKLMDAMWVWTEPNCMRHKLRLTVKADIDCSPGTVQIQQRVLVEFIVKFSQCPECNREYSNRTWHALVQLRQKRTDGSRKGLLLLETAIAKNADIRKHVLRVVTAKNGFDFYFLQYTHAQQFASYLSRISPLKSKTTKKMVSEDIRNNTANMKWTISADVVPLCRDDLVLCCKGMGGGGGGGSMIGKLEGRLALVTKVTSCVHLVDATPVRGMLQDAFADLHPDKYWKGGGKGVQLMLSSQRLERFVVLDVELCDNEYRGKQGELYKGPNSGVDKYALADVEVVRESDFGRNDDSFRCVTHLGNLLQYGDLVLGYDLNTCVLPKNDLLEQAGAYNHNFVMPDVVLVKKIKETYDEKMESQMNDTVEDSKPKKFKAKSSSSKRRERRRQKEEQKELEMERAAARMGFAESDDDDDDNAVVKKERDKERAEFEKQLEDDLELKQDLELVEKELQKLESFSKSEDIENANSEIVDDKTTDQNLC